MFSINIDKLIRSLLPPFKRAQINIDWLTVLMYGLQYLNDTFLAWITSNDERLIFTGQVIYLEHMLNDRFDPTTRGIYIDNVSDNNKQYIFRKDEQRPDTYIYGTLEVHTPVYIYQKSEYLVQDDFIVMIPVALQGSVDEDEVKAWVNYYKLAGKKYTIQYY